MENANAFVHSKLQLISQIQTPIEANPDQAWNSFQRNKRNAHSKRLLLSLAASLILLTSLLPQPRAWAQQAWTTYILGGSTNIALDFASLTPPLLLPNVFPMYPANAIKPIKASSRAEASAAAGFSVYQLNTDLGQPSFRVSQHAPLERTLDKQAIDAELRRLNREPIPWPQGLDGATLQLNLGKSAITHYGQCPTIVGPWNSCAFLLQFRPPELRLSTPIALAALTVFSLELAGLSRTRAQSLAKLGSTFFLPFEENNCTLQQTKVKNSPAVLILYPKAPNGEEAFNLQWQERGFSFSLFGRDPSRAIALAESLN